MRNNIKWSAMVLGVSLGMTAAIPAVPALAAVHRGADHGGRGNQGWHGRHGQWGGEHHRKNHDGNHRGHDRDNHHRGPEGKDRLKVMQSEGEVTAAEAALLSSVTVGQGAISSLFAPGTPFTVYTVRIAGPHARWSGTGTITVSDNNGSLTAPADLYYMGFKGGFWHADPFQGDTSPLNAATVGQSSTFSVQFIHGRAQFAVFDGKAGSGAVQITLHDAALKQSRTVVYPDAATTAPMPNPTAAGVAVAGQPTVSLAPGQSMTVQFQVQDQYGKPLAQSGQTVDLSLAGFGGGAVPAGITLNGGTPTAASPLALQTGADGLVSATLTNVSDATGGSFEVNAVLPGLASAAPAHITVDDIAAQGTVSALALSKASVTNGAVTPLPIPATIAVPVGTTLNAAELGAAVNAPVYIEGINGNGDAANGLPLGDTLLAQSSNPSVLSVSGWNTQSEAVLTSGVTTLPVITAETPGMATVTIQDVTNPSVSSIVLTIDVVAAQPITPESKGSG